MSWVLLLQLYEGGSPELPPAVRALVEHPELTEAVETLLDHGGSVAAAARALNIHRATLHRRLERAEHLTGLRLESGDDRLVAHVSLRLWRLGATTDVAA
jgi:DNA-binding PucR family transcriptional regulator